jgi:esterase/lipase superfamily enzyme
LAETADVAAFLRQIAADLDPRQLVTIQTSMGTRALQSQLYQVEALRSE